jgi:ABC-2 type transport system permease protein
MVVKEFRELRRDRRTTAMLVVLPLLLLVIFGYAANFTIDSVRTEVVGPQAAAVAASRPRGRRSRRRCSSCCPRSCCPG